MEAWQQEKQMPTDLGQLHCSHGDDKGRVGFDTWSACSHNLCVLGISGLSNSVHHPGTRWLICLRRAQSIACWVSYTLATW